MEYSIRTLDVTCDEEEGWYRATLRFTFPQRNIRLVGDLHGPLSRLGVDLPPGHAALRHADHAHVVKDVSPEALMLRYDEPGGASPVVGVHPATAAASPHSVVHDGVLQRQQRQHSHRHHDQADDDDDVDDVTHVHRPLDSVPLLHHAELEAREEAEAMEAAHDDTEERLAATRGLVWPPGARLPDAAYTRPIVLMLHGGGQTRWSWDTTACLMARDDLATQLDVDGEWATLVRSAKRAAAAEGHHAQMRLPDTTTSAQPLQHPCLVLTLDHRGHGQSDWHPEGDYDISEFTADAAALITCCMSRPPVLVGASLGGIVGILVEGSWGPSCVSALVLVDIAPQFRERGASRVLAFMAKHAEQGFATVEEAAAAVAAYQPHRKRDPAEGASSSSSSTVRNRAGLAGLRKNLRLHADGRFRWHWDPALLRNWYSESKPTSTSSGTESPTTSARDADGLLTRITSRLRVPVLLVRGQMSDLVDREVAAQFLRNLPTAEYVPVAEAAHMVAGDKNDVFSACILDFIARRVPVGHEAENSRARL